MGLETPGQKLWALGIILAFIATLVLAFAAVITSLSDENVDSFGSWLEDNIDTIAAGVLAAVPSIATYLFGRRAGRKVGKTEAYASAISTVSGVKDTDTAEKNLRNEAKAHNLRVLI